MDSEASLPGLVAVTRTSDVERDLKVICMTGTFPRISCIMVLEVQKTNVHLCEFTQAFLSPFLVIGYVIDYSYL